MPLTPFRVVVSLFDLLATLGIRLEFNSHYFRWGLVPPVLIFSWLIKQALYNPLPPPIITRPSLSLVDGFAARIVCTILSLHGLFLRTDGFAFRPLHSELYVSR